MEETTNKTEKRTAVHPFKPNKKGKHKQGFMNFVRLWAIPLLYIIKPFRYYGSRKVKDGPCIYVCNHYSSTDPLYVACTTWEAIHFVPKKSLMNVPVLGGILRKFQAIPVNRDGTDVRALLDCLKCLKAGDKISIFPEGTRNKTQEEMLPFKHGAAMLAIRTKSPVIPMVIYKKPRLFRMTHILIGEPIYFEEYYDKKLKEQDFGDMDEMLRQRLLQMKAEHTEFLANKKKKKAKS